MLLIDRRQRAQRREVRDNATTLDRLLIRMWASNDFTVPPSEVQWLKATARESDVPLVRTIALRAVGWAAVGGRSGDLRWQPCPTDDLEEFVSIMEEAAGSECESVRHEAEVGLGRVRMFPQLRDPGRFEYTALWTGPSQTPLSERLQISPGGFPRLVSNRELIDRCEALRRDGASEEAFRWLMFLAERYKGLRQQWTALRELHRLWRRRSWALRLRPRALDPLKAEVVRFTCAMLEDERGMSRIWTSRATAESDLCRDPRVRAALRTCCDDESTAVSWYATRAMLADVWK